MKEEEKIEIMQELSKLINFNFGLDTVVQDGMTRIYGGYDKELDSNLNRLTIEIFRDGSLNVFWFGEKTGDYVCKSIQEVLLCMNIYLGFKKTALFLDIPEIN